MVNKNLIIVLLSIALLTVIFFKIGCNKTDTQKPVIIPNKTITSTVTIKEVNVNKEIDSLESIQLKLEYSNKILNESYLLVKKKILLLNDSLKSTLKKLPDSNIIDFEELNNIESIVNTLENNNLLVDSLCFAEKSNLNKSLTIANKNISLKDSLYQNLKSAFNTSLQNTEKLQSYNTKLLKQVKSKKASVVLWKIVTIAATGLLIKKAIN